MKINSYGAEIEGAHKMEIHGDWIMFEDNDGSTIKIDPSVVRQLAIFMLERIGTINAGVCE